MPRPWENDVFQGGDGAIALGGYTWPPSSYSCNFCKREFLSPKALGGHMNVHRRDRAKLKLTPESCSPWLMFSPPSVNPKHLKNEETSSGARCGVETEEYEEIGGCKKRKSHDQMVDLELRLGRSTHLG